MKYTVVKVLICTNRVSFRVRGRGSTCPFMNSLYTLSPAWSYEWNEFSKRWENWSQNLMVCNMFLDSWSSFCTLGVCFKGTCVAQFSGLCIFSACIFFKIATGLKGSHLCQSQSWKFLITGVPDMPPLLCQIQKVISLFIIYVVQLICFWHSSLNMTCCSMWSAVDWPRTVNVDYDGSYSLPAYNSWLQPILHKL